MLIDTHAHLDEDAFASDRRGVIDRAVDAGITTIFTIGINQQTSEAAVRIAEEHFEVHAVVGIQPNYVAQMHEDDWDRIFELSASPCVVAIGETGLDRYWDYAPLDAQQEWFRRHISLAQQIDKPFIVHCRDAEADVVALLQEVQGGSPYRGVMHSFCGDASTAQACLAMGLHLSFSGMLTYKRNDDLRAIATSCPADRLLVETDAPYLAPVPNRGKTNEPAWVRHTAECLAQVRGVSLEEIARQTTENAQRLFRLGE